jgi:predicted transcriptional regulator
MAAPQEMILKLLFNDDGTFVGLEQINNELQKVDNSTTQVEQSTKGLKQQYAELRKEQDKYDPGTEKFNELSVQMGELKDRMNDAADAVRGNTGPAVEGLRNSFGMMGEQIMNLDFEGLTQSLNLVTANINRIDTKALGEGLSAAFRAGVAGVKALGKAIAANPLLLLASIIAGIIAYWEELTALFEMYQANGVAKVKYYLEKSLEAMKKQEQSLTKQIALSKAYGDSSFVQYRLQEQLLKNQIKQQETQMRIAEISRDKEKLQESYNKKIELQNQLAVNAASAQKEYNDGLVEAYGLLGDAQATELKKQQSTQKLNQLLDEANVKLKEQQALQANVTTEMGGAADFVASLGEQVKDNNEKVWKDADIFGIKQTEADIKLLQDVIKKTEAQIEKEAADARQAKIDARNDFEQELRNDLFKSFNSADAYELELIRQQYEKKKKEAKKNGADLLLVEEWYTNAVSELLISQNEREYKLEQDKINKKLGLQKAYNDAYAQAMADEQTMIETIQESIYEGGLSAQELELKQVREHYLQLITEAEYYGQNAQVLKDKQAKAELDITKKYAEAETQLRVDTVKQGLAALTALNESFTARTEKTAKRQFNTNKALNIAMSLVDTYAAIVKALNSPETVPTSVKIAQAVAVGVMGFANVAKIAKTQFGGMTPDTSMNQGGNTDSTTQANAPAIDFSGGQFNPNGPGTVETYVLAGNVANALEARQKIIDQSYL